MGYSAWLEVSEDHRGGSGLCWVVMGRPIHGNGCAVRGVVGVH